MATGRERPEEAGEGRTDDLYRQSTLPTRVPSESTAMQTPLPGDEGESTGSSGQTTRIRTTEVSGALGPGQVLFDKYLVERKLGEGGMGEVWLIRHLDLDVRRALKLIISNVAFNEEHRARFRREARVMARFSHPNAVTVHDAVVRADGNVAYIEMEFVQGKSLKDLLVPGVPMPLDWIARVVAQLCEVLQVAHDNGIVHRDLKPSNLMLLDGRPAGHDHLKVLDFGIAKILGGDPGDPEAVVTRTGMPLGTPQYMSPEQIIADPRELDARSDLYSVGIILYELLTGHRAFDGKFHKLIYDHMHTPPPHFAEKNPDHRIPPEVERVVLRCLEKDPDRRPQSARELAEEFHAAVAPPVVETEESGGGPRRWLRIAWAVPVLLVGLAWAAATGRFAPPSFSLDVEPPTLKLRAGDSRRVSVSLRRNRLSGPVTINTTDDPRGITATREPAANPDNVLFTVAADLNLPPSPRAGVLTFRGTTGRIRATRTVGLVIDPPVVALPPRCRRSPGARLVREGSSIYPDRIVRDFPAPDLGPVTFLLVNKDGPDDPNPFYIMENKVWNALFARYAAENPRNVDQNSVWRPIAEGGRLPDPDRMLPAFNVSAKEAHEFAAWLGGRLPSGKQWDKAAGLDHPGGRLGPFNGTWQSRDKTEIAVDRAQEGPLPVGAATRDISPTGCRDMAGNGLEWTRDPQNPALTFPLAPGTTDSIILRGRSYEDSRGPLLYDDLKAWYAKGSSGLYDEATEYIGFRVVLEIHEPK